MIMRRSWMLTGCSPATDSCAAELLYKNPRSQSPLRGRQFRDNYSRRTCIINTAVSSEQQVLMPIDQKEDFYAYCTSEITCSSRSLFFQPLPGSFSPRPFQIHLQEPPRGRHPPLRLHYLQTRRNTGAKQSVRYCTV